MRFARKLWQLNLGLNHRQKPEESDGCECSAGRPGGVFISAQMVFNASRNSISNPDAPNSKVTIPAIVAITPAILEAYDNSEHHLQR